MALGESFFLSIHKKDLRTSRDWVGNQWIDIQVKPDILSAISATFSPDAKMSMSSTVTEDVKPSGFALSCTEVPAGAELVSNKEKKPDVATLISKDGILDHMDSDDKADEDGSNDINVCHDKVGEVQDSDEGDGKDNNEKTDIEALESSEKNCKAVECMGVTA